ncbi:ABC transporter substrate-binding protein [Salinisphaera hydrothermalis]|uniref:ABC transporter substrate-binding protein n=1 Tax=Salinisphaera hydrothermalis TaxID=563188 RepID=UPI00333F6D72
MKNGTRAGMWTRRRVVQGGLAGIGALALAPMVLPKYAAAATMPDPDKILDTIKPGNYVPKKYLEQFGLGPDSVLWDPKKDWIRTADWESIRSRFAGQTVRFAVGAADADSVQATLKPFKQLSGIDVEVISIPDASFYTKAVSAFVSGSARFDALEYFSPWLGDFSAPGFLHELGDYVDKYKLPYQDFADTYWQNYALYSDKGVFGIPYDCDFKMFMVRNKQFKQYVGHAASPKDTVKTWDDVVHFAKTLNKPDAHMHGIGYMGGRGFWSTYTWEHIAAQYGLDLLDSDWKPKIVSDAGIKAVEILVELKKYAPQGIENWGWADDRSAWLGGQLAMNMAWQDQANQATRPDQSRISGDEPVALYEPRGTGPDARFAPPNLAGSTASIAANARNPEAAFVMLAFFTTASLQAMNGASANGVAPGFMSVIENENFQKIMPPSKIWGESLPYAWAEPRIPGMYQLETTLGLELNKVIAGDAKPKEALQAASKRWEEILRRKGFYGSKPPVDYSVIHDRMWLGRGKKALV